MSRPGPRAVQILLSDKERAELGRWVRGEKGPRLAQRARIVLTCGEGFPNSQVASWLDMSVITVSKWRSRFAEHRVAGLVDTPRPGRPARELVLSQAERTELTRWARRATSAQALALRSKIVLACADGGDNKTIAAELGCTAGTVSRWRRRFSISGLEGLVDEDRPGRPTSITLDQVEDVLVATLESTPKNATHWSRSLMAKKTGLSGSTIGRIWKDFGLQPHRADGFKLSSNPAVRGESRRRRGPVPQPAREGRRAVCR